jgi:hypothetical protein
MISKMSFQFRLGPVAGSDDKDAIGLQHLGYVENVRQPRQEVLLGQIIQPGNSWPNVTREIIFHQGFAFNLPWFLMFFYKL